MLKFMLFILILVNCYGGEKMPEHKRIIQRSTTSERIDNKKAELEPNELAIAADTDDLVFKNTKGEFVNVSKDKYRVPNKDTLKQSTIFKIGDIVIVNGDESNDDGAEIKVKISNSQNGEYIQLNNGLYANIISNNSVDKRLKTKSKTTQGAINEIYNEVSIINTDIENRNIFITSLLTSFGRNNPYKTKGLINIVGDSISQGYDSTNNTYNSYVSILKRLLRIDLKTSNIGFEPFQPDYLNYTHKIINHTNWLFENDSQAKGANTLNGACYYTNTTSEFILDIYPIKSKTAIHFIKFSGGGTADIYVNDIKKGTINCNGDSLTNFSVIDSEYGNSGKMIVKIVPNGNGEIRLTGVSFFDTQDDLMINNFSQSGRSLLNTPNSVIDSFTNCDLLIFALNHNDYYGEDNIRILNEKLNKIKELSNSRNTNVVFLDFRFNHSENDLYRKKLKEICSQINGAIYINFPNAFKPDKTLTTQDEKLNVYKLFVDDTSHPSDKGMEVIAATIARRLGLTYHTKKDSILKLNDWYPLPLENGVSNVFKEYKHSSKYRLSDTNIEVSLYFKNDSIVQPNNKIIVTNFNNLIISEHTQFFTKEEEFTIRDIPQELETVVVRTLFKDYGIIPKLSIYSGKKSSLGAGSSFVINVQVPIN